MSLDAFVERMREKQADLFSSTVTLTRPGAPGAFDETTATYAAATPTTVYTGDALVRPEADAVTEAGDVSIEVTDYLVKLPTDTAAEIGDIVTVTASDHDAGLVGLTLRVLRLAADEWQMCRRLHCVRETRRPT